jgi:hypothetical protein
MKALIVREPWIDLILDGHKTWELRTRPTSIRGQIALIRQGSGQIEGVVNLADVLPRMSPAGLAVPLNFTACHGQAKGDNRSLHADAKSACERPSVFRGCSLHAPLQPLYVGRSGYRGHSRRVAAILDREPIGRNRCKGGFLGAPASTPRPMVMELADPSRRSSGKEPRPGNQARAQGKRARLRRQTAQELAEPDA